MAAPADFSEAGLQEGIEAFHRADLSSAYHELKPLAEAGDRTAQYYLGAVNQIGLNQGPDPTEAIRWYRKAADQGLREAQYSLGMVWYTGVGAEKDLAEAARWFEKAALQNDPDTQYLLGVMYEKGQGVPRNLVQAYRWLDKASDQGHPAAAIAFHRITEQMTEAQLAEVKHRPGPSKGVE